MTNSHWTMVISLKEVIPPQPVMNSSGYPVKSGIGGGDMMSERRVLDRLQLTVTADSEAEAYRKVRRLLEANAPELVTGDIPLADDSVTVRPK